MKKIFLSLALAAAILAPNFAMAASPAIATSNVEQTLSIQSADEEVIIIIIIIIVEER